MDGSPFNTTLPLGIADVGCVTVPINGGDGEPGTAGTTALPDKPEMQPPSFVTVKLYTPEGIPESVIEDPVPAIVIAPGYLVSVHFPVDGREETCIEPVVTAHVGGTMRPITGTPGITGCVEITMFADGTDAQLPEFATT